MAKRGITAVQFAGEALKSEKTNVVPCYLGQAPIWQIDSANWKKLAGSVLLVNSESDMRNAVGYYEPANGKWEAPFSLCEAVALHNLKEAWPVALLVNAKAPESDGNQYSCTVTFAGGEALLEEGTKEEAAGTTKINGLAVLASVSIADKEKGKDYSVRYSDDGNYIVITDLNVGSSDAMNTAIVNFEMVDVSDLKFAEKTFEEFDYFEQTIGVVPNYFAAPGWDAKTTESGQTVAGKLIETVSVPLNGHWYTQTFVQLEAVTRKEALAERKKYGSHKAKVVWPYVKYNEKIYNGSTWWACKRQLVDASMETIPYVSASNEVLEIEQLCTSEGTIIRQNEKMANELNAEGIATFNFVRNAWRTWGVCMSNYTDLASEQGLIPADRLNDVAVQMKDYVSNIFQERYADQLDKPMSKRDCNNIVQNFSELLSGYVADGILLYQSVAFLENKNSTQDLAEGNFTFTITEVNTPPGKSITAEIYYSASALTDSYSEED